MPATFLEEAGLGLTTMAIGIFVVFLGLIILIGMINIMIVFTKREKKAAVPEDVPAVPAETEPEAEQPDEDDESVIAAITAAIACVWQENEGFVVRRVRRIAAPSWQRAAREEQILTRM